MRCDSLCSGRPSRSRTLCTCRGSSIWNRGLSHSSRCCWKAPQQHRDIWSRTTLSNWSCFDLEVLRPCQFDLPAPGGWSWQLGSWELVSRSLLNKDVRLIGRHGVDSPIYAVCDIVWKRTHCPLPKNVPLDVSFWTLRLLLANVGETTQTLVVCFQRDTVLFPRLHCVDFGVGGQRATHLECCLFVCFFSKKRSAHDGTATRRR